MKNFIFMLAMTLLFTTISDDAHSYFVKMIALRVGFMWLLGLMNIEEARPMVEVLRMILHLPFAIMFTILTLRIVNEDQSLALIALIFLGVDLYHTASLGLAIVQEVFQREAPMNYRGSYHGR
jgi:hypothetical protein